MFRSLTYHSGSGGPNSPASLVLIYIAVSIEAAPLGNLGEMGSLLCAAMLWLVHLDYVIVNSKPRGRSLSGSST
ncbi:hypothetical protein F5Y03DRAFT_356184 [Xylaria venustula]|nr:hypothetical protein F5Y03DRAFT_356184 [Xylaria venustula]